MRVGLIGTGVVGRRAARELVGLPGVTSVVVIGGSAKQRARLADSLGPKAESVPTDAIDEATLAAARLDALVLCIPDEAQVEHARLALAVGCHVVSLADSVESVDALFGLDEYARELGRSVVVGVTMSPGWTALLVQHASALFDDIDEVSIAVTGTAGPACEERRGRAVRTDTQEWRDSTWVDCAARSAPELVWFPEPLGAVDCARGDVSDGVLVHRLLPEVPLIVSKVGRPPTTAVPKRVRRLRRGSAPQEVGAIRVAVSGRAGGQPSTVVYGMCCPPATSTAVLAALTVAALPTADRGARSVAEVLAPVDALRGAAERGVHALVYDGID